jgi:hypothetical protein
MVIERNSCGTPPRGGEIMDPVTQPDASWDYLTTQELVAALQARKISAIELTDHVIARIQALDPKINAVVVRDFDRGRAAAKTADARSDNPTYLKHHERTVNGLRKAGVPEE